MKQETVSGSGISLAICKSAHWSRLINTPAPYHWIFCRPDALPATQPTASKHWKTYVIAIAVITEASACLKNSFKLLTISHTHTHTHVLSMLCHCWLGIRKTVWSVKNLSDVMLAWLSVWSEKQMICMWYSWYHCHPIVSCFIKIQNGFIFWCQLSQVVLEKRPLNGCSSSSSSSSSSSNSSSFWTMTFSCLMDW